MRIDRRTLTLIIASLCGTGANAVAQEDFSLVSLASTGRIGDSNGALASQSISDDSGDEGTLSDSGSISDDGGISDEGSLSDDGRISDESDGNLFDDGTSLIPALPMGYSSQPSSASQTVGSGARESSTVVCGPTTMASSRGVSSGWVEFDTLLWWGRGLNHSPVIVGGATPSAFPTTPILGGQDNPIGTDLLLGLRGDVGMWLDDCQNYGFGGRAWGILTDGQEQIITNGGNSTGISFFNVSLPAQDAYLVNINTNGAGANTGTIGVLNELDVFSGELYGKALLIGDSRNRTDLIGGYTFLRLDSGYRLQSIVTDGILNAPPPVGTVTTITDQFATKNVFNGGHLGLSTNMNRGRVGFGLTGKIALGNMQSTSIISGTFNQVPPLPNNPSTANRGLFAQPSNIGTITQDNFTFIPEVNARMRYRLGRAQLGIGYTLVLLPTVAMAASQVDTNVDVAGILSTPIAPVPIFNTESYFLQGLDLGLTYTF